MPLLDYNEKNELEELKRIISQKPKIENNPFSEIPTPQIKKALKLLEEYGEEHNFDDFKPS